MSVYEQAGESVRRFPIDREGLLPWVVAPPDNEY